MARLRALMKKLGIVGLLLLLFFVGLFFYAYGTGGSVSVLARLGGDAIGVIEVSGSIDDSAAAIHGIKEFARTDGIKAVVVRVDSPGGGVAPTQEIYDEIEKLKKKKPVVASLGSIATSGGYYIASVCDRIVANAGTLTGSIGVIIELGNIEELMRKLGLKGTTIKSAPHKDIGSPLRPLAPEDKAILQSLVDNVHLQFIRAVARGRKMDEAKVRELADGRVYSGEQAKELGLVDALGNMEYAINLAAERAGIEGEPRVIYAERRAGSWWERLVSSVLGQGFGGSERWGLRYEWSPSMLQ